MLTFRKLREQSRKLIWTFEVNKISESDSILDVLDSMALTGKTTFSENIIWKHFLLLLNIGRHFQLY